MVSVKEAKLRKIIDDQYNEIELHALEWAVLKCPIYAPDELFERYVKSYWWLYVKNN